MHSECVNSFVRMTLKLDSKRKKKGGAARFVCCKTQLAPKRGTKPVSVVCVISQHLSATAGVHQTDLSF